MRKFAGRKIQSRQIQPRLIRRRSISGFSDAGNIVAKTLVLFAVNAAPLMR
jgi:hypothetical protein